MEEEKKILTSIHDNKKEESTSPEITEEKENKLPKDIAPKENNGEDTFKEEDKDEEIKKKPWEEESKAWIPLILLLILFIAISYWALFSNNTEEEDPNLEENPATGEVVTELPEIANIDENYPLPTEEAGSKTINEEREDNDQDDYDYNNEKYVPGSKIPDQNVNNTVPAEINICTMELVPGLVIKLQDENGNLLNNAVITVNNNKFSEWTNGTYSGLYEEDGTYTVKINKNGYKFHQETFNITKNDCHVNTVNATITLEKLETEPILCTLEMRSGLVINLKNPNGNALSNAVITVNNEKLNEWNNGIYSGLNERAGTYTFKINKNGYRYYEETVTITKDACHVNTINKTITLIPLN